MPAATSRELLELLKGLGIPMLANGAPSLANGKGVGIPASARAAGFAGGQALGQALGIATTPLSFLGGPAAGAILTAALTDNSITDNDLLGRIAANDNRLSTISDAEFNREGGESGDTVGQRILGRRNAHLNILAGRSHLWDQLSSQGQQELADFILNAPRGRGLGEGVDAFHHPVTQARRMLRSGRATLPAGRPAPVQVQRGGRQ